MFWNCAILNILFFIAERDECVPNPCKSAGKCFPADNRIGYHCVCVDGKRGLQCERKLIKLKSIIGLRIHLINITRVASETGLVHLVAVNRPV